jgi:hypothetical protein
LVTAINVYHYLMMLIVCSIAKSGKVEKGPEARQQYQEKK